MGSDLPNFYRVDFSPVSNAIGNLIEYLNGFHDFVPLPGFPLYTISLSLAKPTSSVYSLQKCKMLDLTIQLLNSFSN